MDTGVAEQLISGACWAVWLFARPPASTSLALDPGQGVGEAKPHRVMQMKIVELAATDAVFANPQHAYTRLLLDSVLSVGESATS